MILFKKLKNDILIANKYKILSTIGHGSFGTVYKILNNQDNQM